MPFWRTYYHLVWATKMRQQSISGVIEQLIHSHLHAKAGDLEIQLFAAGGWLDHVHIVASIPPKLSVATAVGQLKGFSAFGVNQQWNQAERFQWQRGYGVFTLGESQLPAAIAYVERQKEHHTQRTTNSWLERIDEPPSTGPASGADRRGDTLREGSPGYSIDELPF